MDRNIDIDKLRKDLNYLKSYVAIVQGIEMLEYHDSTFLKDNLI